MYVVSACETKSYNHEQQSDKSNFVVNYCSVLTLKAPIMTAADDIQKCFFSLLFRENKT